MSHVVVDTSGPIYTIRLNRPDKKNALTGDMYTAMAEVVEQAEANKSVRAVMILGAEGAFCAGNDIEDFLARPPGSSSEEAPVFRFLRSLANSSVPLIAGVDGVAVGIGFTMLLHCDAVFVTARSKLVAPFVDLAIVPEAASTLLLPQRIGYIKAAELFMLAEPQDGNAFAALGLANGVVEPDALDATVKATAERFAAKAPGAMRDTKRLMRGDPQAIIDRMKQESDIFSVRLTSPESREVMNAFMEKRAPDFSKLEG